MKYYIIRLRDASNLTPKGITGHLEADNYRIKMEPAFPNDQFRVVEEDIWKRLQAKIYDGQQIDLEAQISNEKYLRLKEK